MMPVRPATLPSSPSFEIPDALVTALLGAACDGLAFVDPDMVIRATNDPCARRAGVSPGALVGRPAETLLPGARTDAVRVFRTVREAGETFRGDEEAPPESPGGGAWAGISVAPVRSAGGEFQGYLVVDRRAGETQAPRTGGDPRPPGTAPAPDGGEAAQLDHLHQLSTIFDSLQALLYVSDLDTYELLYMNAYGEAMFGPRHLGRPCFDVLQTGQSGPCAFCTNDRIVRDGEPLPPYVWEFQNTVTGRWFQCIDRAIRWTDGRLVRMEVAIDISERKRTEELLREANQTLHALVYASPLAIVAKDREGRITRWNEAAERTFGWTEEEVLGRPNVLVPEEGQGEFEALQQRLWAGETVTGVETRRRRKDGTPIDVSVSKAPLRDAGGHIVGSMALIADITEQKRAEEFRRQYVHTISHDLRNPLMTMLGHAEILQMASFEASMGEMERRSVEAIVRATQRMNVMIQDLVDSARVEGGAIELHPEPVELGSFFADLVEHAGGILAADRIRLDVPPDLPPARADPGRLERIAINLLSNALKYSARDAPVRISAAADGGEIVVSVTDAGRGIDPADQPQLFDRYFRTAAGREAGGLGLGLYITRMLVEAHGGRMRWRASAASGSTFSFTLPVWPATRES
jgi:PAS domain S-box-containing protein